MSQSDHAAIVRDSYRAFEVDDRAAIERLIADDYEFSSPAAVGIDREAWFELCWPVAQHLQSVEITRLIESGDEVVISYVARRVDGTRFCNTDILTVADGQLRRCESYPGWELDG